jgi:F-type H+-transporting ATPase subunit b
MKLDSRKLSCKICVTIGLYILFLVLIQSGDVLAASGGGDHHGNPGPNAKFYHHLFNFVILVGLLFFLLRKPALNFFQSRSKSLEQEINQNKILFAEIKKENDELKKKIGALEAESAELINSFKQSGEEEKERIIKEAKVYAEQLKEDAKKIASSEVAKAYEELKDMVVELSYEQATKLIREEVKTGGQKLVSEFTRDLKSIAK